MNNGIELYIHIPFCARKCEYCDFVSFPAGRSVQEKYVSALVSEAAAKSFMAGGRKVRSVFIGGGTPSLIDAGLISEITDKLRRYYDIEDGAEITIETNPCTLSREKLDSYLESGINRISIGCQSADDGNLKVLGRLHDFKTFMKAYETAVSCGFKNINVDMISALPFQTAEKWKKELETVAALDIQHISVYSLILEEGTPMYERRGEYEFPDEDEAAAIYGITNGVLLKKGFERYEISNYSKKGFECVHNTGYWTGVPYLGFGISASSYFNGRRWTNCNDIGRYMSAAGDPEALSGISEEAEALSEDDMRSEFMILGLRLTEGISCAEFRRRFKKDIFEVFGEPLGRHLSGGTLVRNGDMIRIPEKYMFVSNSILVDFI